MVQRAMAGPELSIDCLGDRDGRCLNAIPRTMLESRGGESIKGAVVRDEELIALGRRTMEALAVSGPQATTLLAAGCPLDLDASAFPVGMCTRTMLAKAEVVLWRTDPQVFRLEVWRSFVAYVSQFLGEAARGII